MQKKELISKHSNITKSSGSGKEKKKFFSYHFYAPAMWIGGLGLILILLLFGRGAFQDQRILSCPQSSSVPCGNPYYELGCTDNDYCGVRFISPGKEYVISTSRVPSWVSSVYNGVVWSLLLLGFYNNYQSYKKEEL